MVTNYLLTGMILQDDSFNPILSNLGESFERLVTKKDHAYDQNTCRADCSPIPLAGDLKESCPYNPWDWYIYLHLVYFYGKCR